MIEFHLIKGIKDNFKVIAIIVWLCQKFKAGVQSRGGVVPTLGFWSTPAPTPGSLPRLRLRFRLRPPGSKAVILTTFKETSDNISWLHLQLEQMCVVLVLPYHHLDTIKMEIKKMATSYLSFSDRITLVKLESKWSQNWSQCQCFQARVRIGFGIPWNSSTPQPWFLVAARLVHTC